MMYRYETHLHTSPVSRCAKFGVADTLAFYKQLDFTGVFITNHYPDAPSYPDKTYEERIAHLFSDYENALVIGKEIGLDVFFGVEITTGGSDFLIYGLDKEWYLAHPEVETLKMRQRLEALRENGALIVHAHPFREARYIDHIRLFPRSIHGVEIDNACRTDFENKMAALYAENYGFLTLAGSDNHIASKLPRLAGVEFATKLKDEADFIARIFNNEQTLFTVDNPQE